MILKYERQDFNNDNYLQNLAHSSEKLKYYPVSPWDYILPVVIILLMFMTCMPFFLSIPFCKEKQ